MNIVPNHTAKRSISPARTFGGLLLLECVICAGCTTTPYNRLTVVDYPHHSDSIQHYELFDDAYYQIDGAGLTHLILQKISLTSENPPQKIIQTFHIQSQWKPNPGLTYSDASMINATISYVIQKGNSGISYDGGGFASYKVQSSGTVLTGELEGAELQPLRNPSGDLRVFERVRISGRFRAIRDDRRVIRILRQIQEQLGPLPPVSHDIPSPDY